MRIAYMLTSLGIGGAERQAIGLAERMASRSHDVALIVLRPPAKPEWQTHLPVIRLDVTKSPRGVAGGFVRGRNFLRAFEADVLHSHTFPANMAARMLGAAGAVPAVVSTIHNVYEGGKHRTLAYRLTDRFSQHSTAVSQAVADRYIAIGAIPARKCSVITNGIDLERFTVSDRQDDWSRELMHAEDSFVWLAAGRDVPAKDFNNLLAAFWSVRSQHPKTQLRIAGEPDRNRLLCIKRQISGGERLGIRWLGHCNDMPATIASVNAFVLSSAWEGMPLVVGEAMAMEKPVIATDVGGVRELVGDAGVLVPAKNPQALADAMLRVMRMTQEERAVMGKAARLRITQSFDMDAKAREWESLYSHLLCDLQ
jgi:glycosyltransferase involved in cell wall biosynthesis